MSDIVKRLRGIRICENFALVEQAADEIESLRSRLAEAIAEGNHWKDAYAEDVSKLDARLAEIVASMPVRDGWSFYVQELKAERAFLRGYADGNF